MVTENSFVKSDPRADLKEFCTNNGGIEDVSCNKADVAACKCTVHATIPHVYVVNNKCPFNQPVFKKVTERRRVGQQKQSKKL